MGTFLIKTIVIIVSLAIVWLIGSFIVWNQTWFIDSVFGRIIALVLFLSIIIGTITNDDLEDIW